MAKSMPKIQQVVAMALMLILIAPVAAFAADGKKHQRHRYHLLNLRHALCHNLVPRLWIFLPVKCTLEIGWQIVVRPDPLRVSPP